MRSKLYGILLGCGLVVAMAAPSFACSLAPTSASAQPPEQTAQAQQQSTDANSN
ncbi:MAG TPA: hypothetical protein VKS78_15015 [Roseiarcus sp.]|nr:hypothetical protein [Roseiarcus sp.]